MSRERVGQTDCPPRSGNGVQLAEIQAGDATDARRPLDATYRAHPTWSRTSPGERQAILNEIAGRLKARANDYAVMMAAKLAPALAAGNTVVLTRSEVVCLSVLEFFRDSADLLPPGVIDLLIGYGQGVGEPPVTDSRVRKVACTGSHETARKLIQCASVNIIPQTMEPGGKSASSFARMPIWSGCRVCRDVGRSYKGAVCLSGSRTFVDDKIYDRFLDRFSAASASAIRPAQDPARCIGVPRV